MKKFDFDIIVVGAGHAGIEACLAGCRLGLRVGLVTSNLDRIGYMSCNPSIGGLAKGHIVREIDALGGEMGRAADETCIQFKRLNSRKGPAVRGSRSQCDKNQYSNYMAGILTSQPQIKIIGAEAKTLILENSKCQGVTLDDGSSLFAQTVILTTGTFMRAIMYIGMEKAEGGRVGDKATVGISDQLRSEGFHVMRLKTGTPPRLDRDSIDWTKLVPQYGDSQFMPFSLRSKPTFKLPQVPCYLGYTNEQTHQIIKANLLKSPMYCGIIEGVGPRYCPSIEDKITRFADKERHQTFLEPEGLCDNSIYLQGVSTSLPQDIQIAFVRTIPGLEDVRFLRFGYAVEYDCFDSTQIQLTLETRGIENLFFAGQINGTSGYEEAAGQGLIAGINAGLKVLGRDPLVLGRHQAYLGVLIDDLVTKGTREPYRMMTSRAEHRLVLREDNTYERLSGIGLSLGILGVEQQELLEKRASLRREMLMALDETTLVPNEHTLRALNELQTSPILKPTKVGELLRRPEISYSDVTSFGVPHCDDEFLAEAVEIEMKYQGYIEKQQELINQVLRLENFRIPAEIIYSDVKGLSREEVEKLDKVRPITLGQAQRVSGVNPSAVQALLIYCTKTQKRKGSGTYDLSKPLEKRSRS